MFNQVLMNKKTTRQNKAIKGAQKEAKKYYGRTRGEAPKLCIQTMVSIKGNEYVSLMQNEKAWGTVKNHVGKCVDINSLLSLIKESGLTGLSGNGFPVSMKIKALQNAQAEKKYLIVNGVECDPGLVHDKWILQNCLNKVTQGIEILNKLYHFDKCILATKAAIQDQFFGIEVKQVPNRYPMGHEKQLIKNLLNISLDNEVVPAEKGILVMNVQTICAIANLDEGETIHSRLITVADFERAVAKTVEVPIGMDITEVIKKVFPEVNGQGIFTGGGVMSCHPVVSGEKVSFITSLIAYGKATEYSEGNKCKGCGACAAKCPVGIKVYKIIQAIERGKTEEIANFHPEKCIGCGGCSYVCSAGKNIQKEIAKVNGKLVQ